MINQPEKHVFYGVDLSSFLPHVNSVNYSANRCVGGMGAKSQPPFCFSQIIAYYVSFVNLYIFNPGNALMPEKDECVFSF